MSGGILLESGTNELELLVFRVGEIRFGVNVAKVKEIVPQIRTTTIPHAPPAIDGSFMLRDEILTLVNLATFLEIDPVESEHGALIIVTEFNKFRAGVRVDNVDVIHRLSWKDVAPPSSYFQDQKLPLIAVAQINEEVVQILDFESIFAEIFGIGDERHDISNVREMPGREEFRLMVVDDSPTIRQSLVNILHKIGFEKLEICSDGKMAWDKIEAGKSDDGLPYDLVLSDIEMPQMDGLHLCSRIKSDPKLARMPVILFSSIIRQETINKGKAVGADAQITKFNIDELAKVLDECLQKSLME